MVIQMGHGGKVKGPFLNRSVEKGCVCVCVCASVCGGESRNGRNRKKPSSRTRKAEIMINLSGKKKKKESKIHPSMRTESRQTDGLPKHDIR